MGFLQNIFSLGLNIPRIENWQKEIEEIPEPDYVAIPLEYPGRILYMPLVKIGDTVRRNQIIGKSDKGHYIHASISGVVKDVLMVWSAQIFHVPALLIQRNDEPEMSVEEMFEKQGMDFASASNRDKLKMMGVISPWTRPGRFAEEEIKSFPEVQKVIIKGHDEEPTVFVNKVLLQNFPEEIKKGISKAKILSPKAEIILTVSNHVKKWASKKFGSLAKVVSVPDNYEDRIQQMLIPKIADVTIPIDEAYMSRGVAVIAAEYLLNVVNALEGKNPFISKYVTMYGAGIDKALTIKFPVGTTIRHILTTKNLAEKKFGRVIFGGPMRGKSQYTELTPLTKSGHGIFLMEKEEMPGETNLTCINCGRCTQACPINLQIHLIGRFVEFDLADEAEVYHPELCIKCGLCAYVCPAQRPLLQFIQMYKKFHGMAHEANNQEIECSGKSTLEGWELRLRDTATVDNSVVTSTDS